MDKQTEHLIGVFSSQAPGVEFSAMSPLFSGERRVLAVFPDSLSVEIVVTDEEQAVHELIPALVLPWVNGVFRGVNSIKKPIPWVSR